MLIDRIAAEVSHAFSLIGVEGARLVPSTRPDIADYVSDAAFAAARTLRRSPASIAEDAATRLSADGYVVDAGGGFLNIRITEAALGDAITEDDDRVVEARTYLIDSGGPNVAKPMHVGHLRSLVIGDALANILRHQGHRVVKDVHYGDWGHQMGLLLAALPEIPSTLAELEQAYPAAAARAKSDPAFLKEAHLATIALQKGEPDHVRRWQAFRDLSGASASADFAKLGVDFDLHLGESDANPFIGRVEDMLGDRLIESEGARVVMTSKGALMFRNREGGSLYGATDLATLAMRAEDPKPDVVLYVVDERQGQYFEQMFEAAEGLTDAHLEHVGFGTVNGPDGRPFKTRAGGVPKLGDLLDEAIAEAAKRNPDVAVPVAMAAIRFGDLVNRRTSGYAFDLERSLRFEGRTGPYMLYQIARIRSIIGNATIEPGRPVVEDDAGRDLALGLLASRDVIERAAETRMPHHVAEHAYDLSQRFSRFYSGASIKDSPARLAIAMLVLERLETLMGLLGIKTVERM